ncbi:MAG: hypothetical protein ACRDPK_11185 [Carbonactinosporaceae bacterium]
MLDEPFSGRLVAWGNAWFAGQTSLDEAAAQVCRDTEPHRVTGLPGETGEVGLTVALGRLRGLGAACLRLALPAPGDPVGLPGPVPFNEEATEAGEAALTTGGEPLGLIPETTFHGPVGDQTLSVVWRTHAVNAPWVTDLPSLAEAERELTETLQETIDTLLRLDVAPWRPEAADTLRAIRGHREGPGGVLAPGYPPRAYRVLSLAQKLGAITELATEDHAGAISADDIHARLVALRPLERCSRRAQLAAYNAPL